MNSLERAKRFLAQKASRLALAVVPLAAIAISSTSARADAVLNGSGGCSVTTGTGSCGLSVTNVSGGNANLNTVSLFTSGAAYSTSGGVLNISGGWSSGGANGGPLRGGVPVAWDFNLITAASDPVIDFTLTFTLYESGGGTVQFTKSGSRATSSGLGTQISGSNHIPAASGSHIVGYSIVLDTSSVNGAPYEINIPGGSTLDLNPLSSVPEPSSLLLMIPGMGALLLMRRKRRA